VQSLNTGALPNSIIIAGNTNSSIEIESKWQIITEGEYKYLIIPQLVINGSIIDGQHRLKGFELIPIQRREEYELLCSIYLDLPNPYQAYLFATININQKAVDKSLAYELYGYNLDEENPSSWSPEKLAVYLARRLNFEEESIFYNHIKVAAENDEVLFDIAPRDQEWCISTASIVDGILSLISTRPKKDRDLLQQLEINKRNRTLLAPDKTPLRNYYLSNNDKLIYLIINNFFKASHSILYKKGSYLFKTVGIQAQFGILKNILEQNLAKDKDISVKYFSDILGNCKEIDFSDNFFTASGLGRLRILNSFLIKLNLKDIEDITNPQDRINYKRLLNLE